MSLYMFASLMVCLCIYLFVYLLSNLYVCVLVCHCIWLCVCVCSCDVFVSVCLSLCQCFWMCMYICVSVFECIWVSLYVCVCVYVSVKERDRASAYCFTYMCVSMSHCVCKSERERVCMRELIDRLYLVFYACAHSHFHSLSILFWFLIVSGWFQSNLWKGEISQNLLENIQLEQAKKEHLKTMFKESCLM